MIETKQSNNFIVSFQVLLQKLSKSDEQVKIEKQQKRCRRLWLELELAEARAGEKLDWEKSGSWTFDRTASQKAALISAASSSKFVIGKFFTGEQGFSWNHYVSLVVLTRIAQSKNIMTSTSRAIEIWNSGQQLMKFHSNLGPILVFTKIAQQW